MKEKFCIIDPVFEKNESFYIQLQERLRNINIDLSILSQPFEGMEYHEAILLTDPMRTKFFTKDQRILGLRTINRKERLEIATDILPDKFVAPWSSPADEKELKEVVSNWGSNNYIFKYDWSASKSGVSLKDIDKDTLPEDYDMSKDVVMKYLDENPLTHKAELFCGKVLNSWVLQTKSIEHEDFLKYTKTPKLFELPTDLRAELEKLSEALVQYGCGYASIDMMSFENNLKIIEINTCAVGRNIAWGNFGPVYLESYTKAIQNVVKNIHKIPTLGNLEERFYSS